MQRPGPVPYRRPVRHDPPGRRPGPSSPTLDSRHGRLAFRSALLALVPLALLACGPGNDDADASPEPDATTDAGGATGGAASAAADSCPLDAAQLSDAAGVEMTATGDTCGFTATASSGTDPMVLEVYYSAIDSFVFDGSAGEPVEGVGDGARWDEQMSGSLLVKDGDRYFSVQVVAMGTLPAELEAQPFAVTVANLAIGA
jgi:hypothetical protein